jgi:hypothetical protein
VIYRVLSTDQPRSQQVVDALPPRWRSVAERHLAARREFVRMRRGRGPTMLPAWRIIQPEPAENLLSYYRKAEAATGIEWEVLAAVNLVETGMGRIDGISVANAQGPMQFLPTTWAEPGIGAGNIRDPHDAIQAAARYLVRRGGLQDIRRGLWGYNNSDYYGRAVLLYASLMKEDPAAYTGLYHWEIHFNAAAGDLWLPVGYNQPQRITVEQHLQANPASRSGSRLVRGGCGSLRRAVGIPAALGGHEFGTGGSPIPAQSRKSSAGDCDRTGRRQEINQRQDLLPLAALPSRCDDRSRGGDGPWRR